MDSCAQTTIGLIENSSQFVFESSNTITITAAITTTVLATTVVTAVTQQQQLQLYQQQQQNTVTTADITNTYVPNYGFTCGYASYFTQTYISELKVDQLQNYY
ncbi:hypothetical protein ACTFIU_003037 [Dictyostelium citrinum]